MAIAIRGAAVTGGNTTATTVTINLTGAQQPQTGDVLLIIHDNDWYDLANMPSPTVAGSSTGVVEITGTGLPVDRGSNLEHIRAYYYVCGSTGDLAVAVTETGTADEEKALAVYVLSGVNNATPLDAAAGAFATASTSHVAPSVSPTSSDAMLFCTAANSANTTYTPPSGMTETYDFKIVNVMASGGANGQLAASGPTGTQTFTASISSGYVAASIALKTLSAAATATGTQFWTQPGLSFPYPAFFLPQPLWTPAVVGVQTEITTGVAVLALGAESTAKKVAKITATSGASALGIGSQATAKKVNVAAARAPLGVGSQATARKLAPATGNGATGLASSAAARKAAPAIGRGPLGLGALSTAAKRSTPTVSGQLGLIDIDTAAKKRSTPLVTAVLGVVDIDTAAKKVNVASGLASIGFAEWAVHVDTRAVTARSILGLVGLATAKKSAPAVANAPQGLAGLSTARKAARPALSVPAGLLGLATAQKRATPAGTAPLGLIDIDLAAKKRATPTAIGALGFTAWANRAARAITALAALGLIDIDLAAKKRATPLATAALGLVDIDTAVKKRATGDTASASLGVLPVAVAGKRQGISGRAIFGLDSWIVFVPPITYGTGNAGQGLAADAMAGLVSASTGRSGLAVAAAGGSGSSTSATGGSGHGNAATGRPGRG